MGTIWVRSLWGRVSRVCKGIGIVGVIVLYGRT